MSRLAAISGSSGSARYETRKPEPAAAIPAGRQIVPVAPANPAEKSRAASLRRANAPYLAHLIATSEGLPQTRERRRATHGEAVASYAQASAGIPARALLLRSL